MNFLIGLQCALCKTPFPAEALYVCTQCLGPLEAVYDYAAVRKVLTRQTIEQRDRNLWRYRELLPITGQPRTGFHSGWTPLVRADRLAKELGMRELYLKDDSVNHPTLSYKDRVVPIAATRAVELGFKVLACASTGNLGNSVAAHGSRLGLDCYIFIPQSLELGKVLGTAISQPQIVAIDGSYDDVNRLCTQIGDKYNWAFVNINLRSYYAEGAKTAGFEIVEQLGWKFPKHVVVPVAGGTLLPRVGRSFQELVEIGLVEGEFPKIHAAQAAGCAPVIKALHEGLEYPEPVKPNTIAQSIAIGNPADGFQVLQTVRNTGGSGAMISDDQILNAMQLLAKTEGIFTEPAGGTTLGATIALIEQGVIHKDESTVVCITGNGYKTIESIVNKVVEPARLSRSLKELEAFLAARH